LCCIGREDIIADEKLTWTTVQLFLGDNKTFFAKNHAWTHPVSPERNGRWAIVIEKDGTVSYAENESKTSQVTVRSPK
jgi:hypothetical protein